MAMKSARKAASVSLGLGLAVLEDLSMAPAMLAACSGSSSSTT
jgi:hypothetical protein